MTTIAAWMHDLSPFLVRFSGQLGIRWYGLSYFAGFVVAFIILRWLARRGASLLPAHRVGDAIMTMVIAVIVGGRLGYVIFYEPSLLTRFSPSPPWWGVLEINRGGMASHGGMIGVFIGSWIIARRFGEEPRDHALETPVEPRKSSATGADATSVSPPASTSIPFLHVADLMSFAAVPGLLLGRLANFVNGELLGKVVALPGQPAPWWAVRFPQEVISGHDVAKSMPPADALAREAAIDRLIEQVRLPRDTFVTAYERVLDKVQHGDAALASQLEPLISARHPSQVYQAFAEGVVLGAILLLVWRGPRKPGVVTAWFLMTYGLLRIATEFYRLPDAHLAVQRVLGLSRGQWLSVGMIAAGATLLAIASRRAVPRLGGWSRSNSDGGSPARGVS